MPGLRLADALAINPADLEGLWQHEANMWRKQLSWDISATIYRLQRALKHSDVLGKVLQAGSRTLACALYLCTGQLGLISNFLISPECDANAAETLLQETVRTLRCQGASRIESSFISMNLWLCPLFEREGFCTYWREFLRYDLPSSHGPLRPLPNVHLQAWRQSHLWEAASIMLAAYEGGVEAEVSEQCRTRRGCELELDDILNQGICGSPVMEASAMAQQRGSGIGFVIITQIEPSHAHVAEVAVLPAYQRQGVGRLLLNRAMAKMAAREFTAVSLFVTRLNSRALDLYKLIGFKPVFSFPVFVWQE